MNLDGTDHFVMHFDTDRDYASACELAINQAGHTYDRCCHYSQWNPRWYVAVNENRIDMVGRVRHSLERSHHSSRLSSGTAWAISAFRYVPNWGVQSWSQLRSTSPRPQGNGLLVFE